MSTTTKAARVALLLLTAVSLAACSVSSRPIPQDGKTPSPSKDAAGVSTCDRAREALLTGDAKSIEGALRALVRDRSADATAREYAQNYLTQDARDPVMRSADKDMIRMACS